MIQPLYLSLNELLGNRLFRIPDYQRHYSWGSKQRDDLFSDINKLVVQQNKSNSQRPYHFMATIVCYKTNRSERKGSSIYNVHDIVDGQQRITTLVVLLKSIALRLEQIGEEKEAKDINELLVKDDERLIILQNNHDNKKILRQYLKSGQKPSNDELKTAADRNIDNAMRECENFTSSKKKDELVEVLSAIKNDLKFILQVVEEEGAVYTIFEVLNSRGLAVDWLDKCKSLLMGLLYEFCQELEDRELFQQHIIELKSYWTEIYAVIGQSNIPGQEIVRFAATLNTTSEKGRTLSAQDSIDFFRQDCISPPILEKKISNIVSNTIWLRDVAFQLSKLYQNKKMNAITDIAQARLLAVAILLSKVNDEAKQKLLDQWEKVAFRIYGINRKDSRTKVGDFVRVAKKINRDKDENIDVGAHEQSIREIGKEFTISESLKAIKWKDCYNGWEKELRYLLYCYEEYLAEKRGLCLDEKAWATIWKGQASRSIEHIVPQTRTLPCWQLISDKEFSDDDVHVLGNLTLLTPSENSQAGNRCFEEKVSIYSKSTLYLQHDLREKKKWGLAEIRAREEELLEFVRMRWE